MSSNLSGQALGDAVLRSIAHGTYPESEDVASAELPSTALPYLAKTINKARGEAKGEIRVLSREAAPDVDGWIAQAKQLQADIERSRETAHDIVQQAEAGKAQRERVRDAENKTALLRKELVFNETLAQTVESIQSISELLDGGRNAATTSHVEEAFDKLQAAEAAIARLGAFENSRIVGVLQNAAKRVRGTIVDGAIQSWNALAVADSANGRILINQEIPREPPVHINTVVEALSKLSLIDNCIARLCRDLDSIILTPRFKLVNNGTVAEISIRGNELAASGVLTDLSLTLALHDIHQIIDHLKRRLPDVITVALSDRLVPIIQKHLVIGWLEPSIPIGLDGLNEFQSNLSKVRELTAFLDQVGWNGGSGILDWVNNAPRIWLATRQQSALAGVRSLCSRGLKERKLVERAETQMVARDDVIVSGEPKEELKGELKGGAQDDDDWGAEWDDEEEAGSGQAASDRKAPDDEEEDVSAWGLDEDGSNDTSGQTNSENKEPVEDEAEAWGWEDDEDTPAPPAASKSTAPPQSNGTASSRSTEQELTLKETYTVTAIPDSIVEIIAKLTADGQTLSQPQYSNSAIAAMGTELYSVPTLVLAMYRATATTHYSGDVAGNMLIYNDCIRLSDQLRSLMADQSKSAFLNRLNLVEDIKAIQGFGKRAYGREMESQRTIVRDLIDGAQGFNHCTVPPYSGACDDAVSMTVDRINEMARQWQDVLSHSVRLQSLGSLLSTVMSKVIADVEDMTDISEEESKRLLHFCNEIAKLSDLFAQDGNSTAHIYTPNWFKFRYLSEILESSLVDITYLWTEAELRLEMEPEEVIDLIKALFQDSEHRRRAIGEIRRTSLVR